MAHLGDKQLEIISLRLKDLFDKSNRCRITKKVFAKKAGVSETTVYRWVNKVSFDDNYLPNLARGFGYAYNCDVDPAKLLDSNYELGSQSNVPDVFNLIKNKVENLSEIKQGEVLQFILQIESGEDRERENNSAGEPSVDPAE